MMEARAGPRACIQANDAIASEPDRFHCLLVRNPLAKLLMFCGRMGVSNKRIFSMCHSAFCTLVLIIRQNVFLRGILALNIGCICLDMHFSTGLATQC